MWSTGDLKALIYIMKYKDGKVVNPLNFYYGNISVEYVAISKLANQENQSLD
jgi:hypothetical protein